MSVDAHYFSPTTPGASSFDEDVSFAIRRGRIGPLSKEAQLGAVGSGVCVLDDEDGTLGHDGDGILGLKQWYMNETECPAGNQRFFTGYTFDRGYYRANSLVQGAARTVDVTLMDANAFLSFRVFAPEAEDPTSSFNRPEETHIQRIQALLDVDFLSTTLFDLGYIPSTGGVLMSAKDYEGSKPVDVLNDCAQVSGWNGWVGYGETENKLFLWFDDWKTDGADTLPYDSTLRLTNLESERDDVTTFLFEMSARESRSPSRVVSAAYGTGTGVKSYRTRPETAHTFGWRDMVAPSYFVKDQAKLDALLDRYLEDNSTEDIRINLTVQIPVDKVTAIKEGQRIEVHGTHMKSVADDFTWCRILHQTIRRDLETMEFYWMDLEVSPIPPPVFTEAGMYQPNTAWAGGAHYNFWHVLGDENPLGPFKTGLIDYYQRDTDSWSGFVVSGSGTMTAECQCSMYTIHNYSVDVTVSLRVNGVAVHSFVVPSSGGPGRDIVMGPTDFDVVSGDLIEMWFEPSPDTDWSLPVGPGGLEFFFVSGTLRP